MMNRWVKDSEAKTQGMARMTELIQEVISLGNRERWQKVKGGSLASLGGASLEGIWSLETRLKLLGELAGA